MRAVHWSQMVHATSAGAGAFRPRRPGAWHRFGDAIEATLDGDEGDEDAEMDPAVARAGATAGRFEWLWPLVWVAWLPALAPPITALFQAHPAPPRLGAVLAGLALFIAVYLWAAWQNDVIRAATLASSAQALWRWQWGPVVVLTALSAALILGDGPRWLALCIYTGSCAGARLPLGQAVRAVVALVLLIVALGWLARDPWSDLVLAPFWVVMAGSFVILLKHLRQTNRSLQVAREENARLAVEAERLRFARDLHDLLGHNLAHIALKSEVAEALVATAPDQAGAAMREVGNVARTALQEVRAAVAGYRRPTLVGELRGAREILAAAGIGYHYQGENIDLPPEVEAVLAWTVREGVINVIRHSRARRCAIELVLGPGEVGIEVSDDGRGPVDGGTPPLPGSGGGSGLQGLAERASAVGGRFAAGPRPGGGFRVSVTVPLNAGAEGAPEDRSTLRAGAGGQG